MKNIFVFLLCGLLLMSCANSVCAMGTMKPKPAISETPVTDEEFLDLVQYKTLQFFLRESNKETGLVKDRAHNFVDDSYEVSSIASVGFALPAYVIGAERGWIKEREAYERVRNTLVFFKDKVEHVNGFYYHFLDMNTGERYGESELSSIDTALFLAGVLFVRQYYKGTEVEELAEKLYYRVDWQWMLNGGETFSMGWKPDAKEGRFLKERWQNYDESMILYILGIGSPTFPIPATTWDRINRIIGRYGEHVLIISPQLFTHQYSHAFIDFRNKHDKYADYFQNSIEATRANREFCIDNKDAFQTYSGNVWGLTSSDGPEGYKAYGAKPGHAYHDGTVAPTAAGGSIVFTPELSKQALREMYDKYKTRIWGRYGFVDAFNIDKDWFATDVIGIDQGIKLLMIENYRTGLIWEYFMRNPEVIDAMEKIGFQEGSKKLSMPKEIPLQALYRKKNIFIDGDLTEWKGLEPFACEAKKFITYGSVSSNADFFANIGFLWDEEYLYIAVKVDDENVYFRKNDDDIFKNDCVELFFDPDADGLLWGNKNDIQLGLSPDFRLSECRTGKAWAWFQNVDPMKTQNVHLATAPTRDGYLMEAAIRWSFIGLKPHADMHVRMSPAFHDYDEPDKSEAKMNIFFQDLTGKDERKKLTFLILRKEHF